MRTWLTILVAALLLPGVAWAQAALTNATFQELVYTDDHHEALMIRCDNTPSIADPGVVNDRDMSYIGGEACEAGDWTDPLDCRGMPNISIHYYEYSAAGTSVAKVWDCLRIPGPNPTLPSTVGGTIPSVEASAAAPATADPDPLCVSLDDSIPIVLTGTVAGNQLLNMDGQSLHFIVGEIDACTNCDSTLVVSCGR